MQQYSSLPEQNSQLNANLSTVLTTMEQLRAELWLESSLNQLQNRLNNFLTLALSKDKQAIVTEAEVFQSVVNELKIAIDSIMVPFGTPTNLAMAIVQPQITVCKICSISFDSTTDSDASPLPIILEEGKKLRLTLNSEINFEDLQKLEDRKPQSAWCLANDALGTIGWLIFSYESFTTQSPANSSSGVCFIEKIPELMIKATKICTAVLTQLKQIESLRQKAEQLDNRNQELKRTNQLKNQFLANTSHEIRTPLSSIIGFTHLILAQGYDPSRQRHHEYLNIIQSSGKHLLALINDILDLSKIEANQLEINWEKVDVPQLCRNVLALVKEKAANKGLQMSFEIDSSITTMVADSLRLKQILLNLLFNAVKFTKSGTVGLEVKPQDQKFMRFTVWDTGIGISEEHQSQLFQPYFQIFNEQEANIEEGTGLGLTVTRKLAQIHGGWVEVESLVDQGSYFSIVLPIKQNQFEKEIVKKSQSQTDNNCNIPKKSKENSSDILLVEDDIPNAQLIQTYLEKLGYKVTWVMNASQMWTALNQINHSVILIDIILPDANGLTLVKQLRKNSQYCHIPIIAQTAMAMKGDRDTCLEAGVNDYICKPIDLPLLGSTISQYITAS